MAYQPRPTMMSGVPVQAMVGTPFTLGARVVPTVGGIPMTIASAASMRAPIRTQGVIMSKNTMMSKVPNFAKRIESSGPAVTLFVGNITERAPDIMIRHVLNACGPVLSWKRVQGASGKLQAFGFCEFANPEAALRAIRLLHNYEIASKTLTVKADSKTTEILEEYKEKKRKSKQNGDKSPLQDEKEEDSYLDADMKAEDKSIRLNIDSILVDHKKDIQNYIPPPNRNEHRDKKIAWVQEKIVALSNGADLASIPSSANLDDFDDVEEGKKEIISREITQFREQMKKQEEEKERDRKAKEKDKDVGKDRERDRDREREKEREWEREREERERERERREREEKIRRRSRSPNERRQSRSPSQGRRSKREKRNPTVRSNSPNSRKSEEEKFREKEEEAEEKERKEQERKVRKKELQYKERLKNWEIREHKKQKELDRESDKDKQKDLDRERDARKLKEFLEDYDDERDDPKYYKGHAFQRKLVEREHEKEVDAKDRAKEKEELEELRSKILSEGHDNPDHIFERACAEREELYKPKLLVKPAHKPQPEIIEATIEDDSMPVPPSNNRSEQSSDSSDDDRHSDAPPEPIEDYEMNDNSQDSHVSPPPKSPSPPKRKKFDVKDVFNQDDDEMPNKKKKLPLPGKDKSAKEKGPGGDDKRKQIKNLIEKIPTSKQELFAYPIDSSMVDNVLMEKRIRPWINKKITEYIGEPEPSLVDFICSKILVGSDPQSLLNDVQMVLDDDAEVFVVKMWRLLIYEIEAKKKENGTRQVLPSL